MLEKLNENGLWKIRIGRLRGIDPKVRE